MSFESQVRAACERIEKRLFGYRRAVIKRLFTRIVEATPVDTGKARDNWFPSIGAPVEMDFDAVAGKRVTLTRVNDVVARMQGGETVFIRNNRPYIVALEHGWSNQAPAGMMSMEVARFQATAQEVAREEGLA
jgi:hypothetical protein